MSPAARRRSFFPWPDWSQATSEVADLAARAQAHVLAAPPTMEARVRAWLEGAPLNLSRDWNLDPALRHPLSPWFAPDAGAAREGRSLREWSVVDEFGGRLVTAIAAEDTADFVRGLATLASHGLRRRVVPRRRGVGTERDQSGRRVAFPPAASIADRMVLIHERLRAPDGPVIHQAVIALAAISNCHPFVDGNGRTGRMLFNALLRHGLARPRLYAPLHELTTLAGGTLTLAVREAELHGRWEPLFGFVERCLFLMANDALPSPTVSVAARPAGVSG